MKGSDDGMGEEAQLQSGWRHFELAERAARFGYWRTTLSDNKMFWSRGMYNLLEIDPSRQQPDMGWLLDAIQPQDVANLREKIAAAIKTRSSFTYRTHAKDAAAMAQIVDTHGEVELGADGRVVAVAGVCTDVTAEVTAETEREMAQARYRVMAEEASDVIQLQEGNGVVWVSSALERVLKRKPAEMEHGRYLALVHPDDLEEARKVLGRPPPGETWTATYRIRHADGHYVWFEISTRGVYDDSTGSFRSEISVGRDITERKRQELEMRAAQHRAEAANRAKSQFLANMSHELRTPLNAILGFTDIMRLQMLGPLGNDRYGEYAKLIHDSARLLLTHIADILEMAKIENGELTLALETVEVKSMISDCLGLVRQCAIGKSVELAMDCPETLSFAADPRAVQQILLNLLSNAIKFTADGGHVSVCAGRESGKIVLTIRDDGFGIPDSELPRLGRPFEQVCADPLVAKGGTGTGLGLAIVRSLVEKHGGAMRIDSTEGVGTEVRIEFPSDIATEQSNRCAEFAGPESPPLPLAGYAGETGRI